MQMACSMAGETSLSRASQTIFVSSSTETSSLNTRVPCIIRSTDEGHVHVDELVDDTIIPVKSHPGVVVLYGPTTAIPTEVHVVDPWIRPPRGVTTQQALGRPGDFASYPRVTASPFDRIDFIIRPIAREGSNLQRHGVYLITDHDLVRDYIDGKTDNPCVEPVFTDIDICQVMSDQGLNGTSCPHQLTLFPLLEIFGSSGAIKYSVTDLDELAQEHGLPNPTDYGGSRILVFTCPWIQQRSNVDSRVSHCAGGMYLVVQVVNTPSAPTAAPTAAPTVRHLSHHFL